MRVWKGNSALRHSCELLSKKKGTFIAPKPDIYCIFSLQFLAPTFINSKPVHYYDLITPGGINWTNISKYLSVTWISSTRLPINRSISWHASHEEETPNIPGVNFYALQIMFQLLGCCAFLVTYFMKIEPLPYARNQSWRINFSRHPTTDNSAILISMLSTWTLPLLSVLRGFAHYNEGRRLN
jgi:hypothetical protein